MTPARGILRQCCSDVSLFVLQIWRETLRFRKVCQHLVRMHAPSSFVLYSFSSLLSSFCLCLSFAFVFTPCLSFLSFFLFFFYWKEVISRYVIYFFDALSVESGDEITILCSLMKRLLLSLIWNNFFLSFFLLSFFFFFCFCWKGVIFWYVIYWFFDTLFVESGDGIAILCPLMKRLSFCRWFGVISISDAN